MKNKFLIIGLPIIGLAAVVGVSIASAAGMFAAGKVGGAGPGGMAMGGGFGGSFNAVSPADFATSQATQFQAEATALGLNESIIVNGWAAGDSLQQIATANGITAAQLQSDMKTYEANQQTADLQALVTAGTITQAQMTQREAAVAAQQSAMQTAMANASGTWAGGHGGFGGRGKLAPTSTVSTSGSTN